MRRRRGRPSKLSDDCKWVTNWPHGQKWGSCSAALAAQIAAEGRWPVMLVSEQVRVSRLILHVPEWAQTLAQRSHSVALALRLSPLDRLRASQAA